RKLRRKLEKLSAGWEYIHTHFGVGYRFEPEEVLAADEDAAPAGAEPAIGEPAETADADAAEPAAKTSSSKAGA
ncbi:MAG: winged helix-turn-helix domain-containing protein, partial [Solirubrobacterales bacterium]